MPPDGFLQDTAALQGTGQPRTDRPCGIRHLRAALSHLRTGLLTFDRQLDLLFTSERLAEMLMVPEAAADGAATLLDLLGASDLLDTKAAQQVHRLCQETVAGLREGRETLSLEDGPRPCTLTLEVSALSDGTWSASFEDVTVRRAAEAEAIKQAMSDPLTGLPNRQLFKEQVAAALARPEVHALPDDQTLPDTQTSPDTQTVPDTQAAAEIKPAPALMLIDLDRFKAVNDTLGHPIGDALLRLVSNRLRSILRANDVVARLGGDEFALMISAGQDEASLARMARRIVDVLGRSYLIDGHLVNIGASLGIARVPQGGATHDELLRNADLALYHAKSAGRGTFSFFEPEMDAKALARRTLEIDLRKALALGELELYYQPQIDLETNGVMGFEALLRWQHPIRGLVSPADFIPLAEEIGMIVPMGDWVIREACNRAATWPDTISVAVNVSPHQFADTARLVGTVQKALAASGLPGERLEIEITESVLLRDEGVVLEALHQMRRLGVRIAMDDFGTGYSSLSQLHSFPFDKIKIDRSFVKDRGDVAGQNAIIRAITALGVSLGMSTIAEGVETPEQLDRIRSEGCTSVQGYLFSRPVPGNQVDAMIAGHVERPDSRDNAQ